MHYFNAEMLCAMIKPQHSELLIFNIFCQIFHAYLMYPKRISVLQDLLLLLAV